MTHKAPKALVLDDDKTTLMIVGRALDAIGVHAICCSSPTLALKILDDNPDINLLVTDYQMPDMNGEEFLQKAAEEHPRANWAVIMTSGVISLPQINHLLKTGVDYFLPKPINLRELCNYVAKAVGDTGKVGAPVEVRV